MKYAVLAGIAGRAGVVQFRETLQQVVPLDLLVVRVEEFLSLGEEFASDLLLFLEGIEADEGEHLMVVTLHDEGDGGGVDARGQGGDDAESLGLESFFQFGESLVQSSEVLPFFRE